MVPYAREMCSFTIFFNNLLSANVLFRFIWDAIIVHENIIDLMSKLMPFLKMELFGGEKSL